MGIATPPLPSLTSLLGKEIHNHNNFVNSMSQDYHQAGIFNFSNGFERSQQEQQHITHQIRRDNKLRIQGFDPPPPLVGIEEESGGLPVYETAGMLSEMFNFPRGGAATTEILENQISHAYRNPRAAAADWFGHRTGMVVDVTDPKNHTALNEIVHSAHHHQHQQQQSAAAMQLFLMNPHNQRSPSPSPAHPPPPSTSSTLHMLLPNPSSSSSSTIQGFHVPTGGDFGQFSTWVHNTGTEIPAVVEGQGLSLSLSSSLQNLDGAKAEELRMGEGGMMFFGSQYNQFKNLGGGALHLQGQVAVGVGSSFRTVNMLRNSKYSKAAQELLEEFCCVGRGPFRKNEFGRQNGGGATSAGGGGNSSSSSKDTPPLSAADRLEHQRRKVKLLSMLDEVDRRYNHYCEQMQMVVNSFDMVMGFGSAVPYTSLAKKAMSRHFRCLKDAVAAQLKNSCEVLGEKDATTSGVTKGETPRLKILEQSLRQQRAFHQMGTMMEQEAWRPQRGLPERSVNILRAWLFEHFLHPYPSDADKHLLARQTGLSRNQVSNWFINARVRLWKPMVEEMYQKESKEDDDDASDQDQTQSSTTAQTPTPPPPPPTTTTSATAITLPSGNKSEINAPENDPSLVPLNTQPYQDAHMPTFSNLPPSAAISSAAADSFPAMHEPDTCRNPDCIESTLIRFGASVGDVSLTLGLRHAGNLPANSSFSVRDFGGC